MEGVARKKKDQGHLRCQRKIMVRMADESVCLLEIGGNVAQGTVRCGLDVRGGLRVLLESEKGGANDAEVVQIAIDGCPEVNVGMDGVRIF